MAAKLEPARHRVLRELSIALGIACTGRAPRELIRAIQAAVMVLYKSEWQGRK